ncbi:hypothetical protein NP233_g12242 [Leucocoprinus birnbaumii]|uniref:Uncharacterized protein n=1 Tax=Leucocoprinus birnbaumii TaxID=56174 RepID=A0AAD5VHF7_9AGAR|nr:hypothetical protein NP233_g12242 [Leucocoprinus birnbaumii]
MGFDDALDPCQEDVDEVENKDEDMDPVEDEEENAAKAEDWESEVEDEKDENKEVDMEVEEGKDGDTEEDIQEVFIDNTTSHPGDLAFGPTSCDPGKGTGNSSEDDNEHLEHCFKASQACLYRERPLLNNGHGLKPGHILQYMEKHRNSCAGCIISDEEEQDSTYTKSLQGAKSNLWAPFQLKMDWEFAKWIKLDGPSSSSSTKLLSIEGAQETLGLSYKNVRELNNIINTKLGQRPIFRQHEVVIQGETMELYCRDMMDSITLLWSDPSYTDELLVEPEHHFTSAEKQEQVYHEMNTGDWWWKTQITRAKSNQKTAYLPTTKLHHIANNALRCQALANLFHTCMHFILKALEMYGRNGIKLVSSNGATWLCFPILAAYVTDYPEQVLVGIIKYGTCAVCPVPCDEIGNPESTEDPRDIGPILEALSKITEGAHVFKQAYSTAGVKPIQKPFWCNLPFLNIYSSITPDILHQLHQGLVKHLISWLKVALGEANLDHHAACMPPNHHICMFAKGISHLLHIVGTEHDQMCCVLLGLVLDVCLPNKKHPTSLIKTVRAVLDIVYLAKYPIHSSSTLQALSDAIDEFHSHCGVFIQLGSLFTSNTLPSPKLRLPPISTQSQSSFIDYLSIIRSINSIHIDPPSEDKYGKLIPG